MPTITAIVHTKNSEKTLAACLESLAFCDEIVVVDMQSTDNTKKIARQFHAHLHEVDSNAVFADPIRDEYLKKVRSDWTLIVDSDEEVTTGLATKIRAVIQDPTIDGYRIPRKNIIFGRWIEHTGFWPDYIVRLLRTGKGSYPPTVHSQPTVDGTVADLEPDPACALIHHHYDSVTSFLMRMNVYTTLESEKILAAGGNELARWREKSFLQSFWDQFATRFFAEQGYKDGTYGCVLSLLMAVYTLVVHIKIWEATKEDLSISLHSIEQSTTTICRSASYWRASELLKDKHTWWRRLSLRLQRKISS